LQRQLETQSRRLDRAGKLLDAYSYKGTLDRGFALVRDEAGTVIRSKTAASSGQAVSLTFADGELGAVITGGTALKAPRKSAKPSKQKETDKKQADLF
jgi:exodeoxyribonuclease VII large subunit